MSKIVYRCGKCKKVKDKEDFHRVRRSSDFDNTRGERQNRCKECIKEANKSPRRRQQSRENCKRSTVKLKLEVFTYYSKGLLKCNCCGESTYAFLTLDHVNNNGAAHRKEIGWGANIWRDLRMNNYPKGYQILCYNCNCGREHNNGVCPHEEI